MLLQSRCEKLKYNTFAFLLGAVSENSHALMASPFKAFSPQPPKFFKPLMPVKEEHKRKTPLESRPLLSQEVIFENYLALSEDQLILYTWLIVCHVYQLQ